jgi:hypothetical protein
VIQFTVTLYWWWLWAYLAVGVALQLWVAWRYRIRPLRLLVSILLWPWAIWDMWPAMRSWLGQRKA